MRKFSAALYLIRAATGLRLQLARLPRQVEQMLVFECRAHLRPHPRIHLPPPVMTLPATAYFPFALPDSFGGSISLV